MPYGRIVYSVGQSTVAPRLWETIARLPALKRRAKIKCRSAARESNLKIPNEVIES